MHPLNAWESNFPSNSKPFIIEKLSHSIAQSTHSPQSLIIKYLDAVCSDYIPEKKTLKGLPLSPEVEKRIIKAVLEAQLISLHPQHARKLFKKACEENDLSFASSLLPSLLWSSVDKDGNTLVHIAAVNGRTQLVKDLILSGAPQDIRNDSDKTPLQIALMGNLFDTALTLIHLGADLTVKDEKGNTPLHIAAKKGQQELIKEIVRQAATNRTGSCSLTSIFTNLNQEKETPLHLALLHKHLSTVDLLVGVMAKIDRSLFQITNRRHFSPLDLAHLLLKGQKLPSYPLLIEMDNGFSAEIYQRKLLAHLFSLKGLTQVGSSSLLLEGANTSKMKQSFYDLAKPYYKDFIAKIGIERNFSSLLSSIGPMEISQQQMQQVFEKTLFAIENCQNNLSQVLAKLSLNDPIAISTTWKGHAVSFVLCNGQAARSNKGDRVKGMPGGVSIATIGKKEKLPEALKKIVISTTREYFCVGIEKELGLTNAQHIYQKNQKVGNCALASLYGMEFALLYLQLEPLIGHDKALRFAKAFQRHRKNKARIEALQSYLFTHHDDFPFPLEVDLLAQIYHKKFYFDQTTKSIQALIKNAIGVPKRPISKLRLSAERAGRSPSFLPLPSPKRAKRF